MYEVELTTTETYIVRRKDEVTGRSWWLANIMIVEANGMLTINSDYGTFSYFWGTGGRAKGNTFKQELIRFNSDYVEDKFSYNDNLGRYFYFDKTVAAIKRDLFEMRRNRDLNEEDARDLYEQICDLEETESSDLFFAYFMEKDISKCVYNNDYHAIPCRTGNHPRLKAFMREVWPAFHAQLVENEKMKESA